MSLEGDTLEGDSIASGFGVIYSKLYNDNFIYLYLLSLGGD